MNMSKGKGQKTGQVFKMNYIFIIYFFYRRKERRRKKQKFKEDCLLQVRCSFKKKKDKQ